MAYIANTAFEARIGNFKNNDIGNITGRFQTSSTDDVCSAGFLCVRGAQLPCEGFTGVVNENAYYMTAATAPTANDVVYAANTYEWPTVQDARTGNVYAIGNQTLGLPIPAGREGTFTVIEFDGQHGYRFGVGNLSAALSTNKYLTIANGLLVPAASAPTDAGDIYFEVRGTGNFVEGATDSFGYVDVMGFTVHA